MNSPRPPSSASRSSQEVKYSSTLAQAEDNVTGAHPNRIGHRLSLQRFGKWLLALLEQPELADVHDHLRQVVVQQL